MCVTRPAEVLDVEGATARVLWQGQPLEVDVSLVGPVAPGEYLLVHAGLALEKVGRDEAAASRPSWRSGPARRRPIRPSHRKKGDEMRSADVGRGALLALGTALISGVSVFVSKFGTQAVPDPFVYTTARNLYVGLLLVGLLAVLALTGRLGGGREGDEPAGRAGGGGLVRSAGSAGRTRGASR